MQDRSDKKVNKENDNKLINKKISTRQAWWQPAVMMFIRFSSWIFAPVIIGAFVGKWLDSKYETEPLLFLSTVGFAFLISVFGLVRIVKEEYKKIERESKDDKNNKLKEK